MSAGTLKELMTLDLGHAFLSEEDRLRESSLQFENLLEKFEEQGRHMGDILIERGIVSQNEWEQLLNEMAESQTPLSTLLVNHRLVQPDQLGELAHQLKVEIKERTTRGASIREILKDEGVLDQEGIDKALETARDEGIRISQAVVSLDLVPFQRMEEVFKKHFDIDSVDLSGMEIEFNVINLVPDNLMKTNELVPYRKKGKKLHLAMSDPRNHSAIKKIEMMTNLEVVPHYADRRELMKRLAEVVVVPEKPGATEATPGAERVRGVAGDDESFQALVGSDSAVKMVSRIIEGALNTKATDIHVEPQEKGLRIRYRIDGMLYDIMTIPRDMGIPTVSRFKVLAGMDVTERRRPQDGHVSYDFENDHVDLRAATLPTNLGEKIVLRVLDASAILRGLANLGLDPLSLKVLKDLIHRPYGMVLVTGPIGSGKTTTMYASICEINQPSRNIVTLEDPVEYELPGIIQVNIDPKIELTFATGLRSVLRQDANVLLVGEIRDAETASTAVRAANTGHLLFSSLHTNNAVGALTALQHLKIPSFQIANALQGVVAQRLVRVLCPECKEEIEPKKIAQEVLGLTKKDKIFKSTGCEACFNTGFQGRTGMYEVLQNTEGVQDAIIHNRSEREILVEAVKEGMVTLAEAGKQKVLEGVTSFEELSRVVILGNDGANSEAAKE